MAKEFYSEMTDRELAEHVARNSDQASGFLTGMAGLLHEIRDGRITIPEGFVHYIGAGHYQVMIGNGPNPMYILYYKTDNAFWVELYDTYMYLIDKRQYAVIPDLEWAKSKGYK